MRLVILLESEKLGSSQATEDGMMLLNNTTENESINACGEEMDAVGIDEAPSILSVETEVINDFDMQRTFTGWTTQVISQLRCIKPHHMTRF